MTGDGMCICCKLRFINGEKSDIQFAEYVIGVDTANCTECRAENVVNTVHLRLCKDCLDYNDAQSQKCPHDVLLRKSEPIRIRESA